MVTPAPDFEAQLMSLVPKMPMATGWMRSTVILKTSQTIQRVVALLRKWVATRDVEALFVEALFVEALFVETLFVETLFVETQ